MAKTTRVHTADWLRILESELPLFLTVDEAAGVLRVHPKSIRRMVQCGELAAVRRTLSGSARVVIPRAELVRWCSEHSAR